MDDIEFKDTQNKSEWLNICQIITLYKIFSLKRSWDAHKSTKLGDYARLKFARIISKRIIYK